MRHCTRAVVLAIIPLVWMGCAPQTQTAGPPSQIRPRSTATLIFLSPIPGAMASGTTLHVQLKLAGAEIVPQTSTDLSPDKGHVHLSLDGRVISMTSGVEQDVTVTPGVHLLQAEFVATDHFPFNPRVITAITVTVR